MIDIGTILRAIGAGVTYSLTAFGKKKDQDFDWSKFGTTIAIGAVAGVVMSLLNLPIGASYEYLVALGAIPVVENLIKIVSRKVMGIGQNKKF